MRGIAGGGVGKGEGTLHPRGRIDREEQGVFSALAAADQNCTVEHGDPSKKSVIVAPQAHGLRDAPELLWRLP